MKSSAALALLTLVVGMPACVFVETSTFRTPAAGGPCNARIFHVPPPAGAYEEVGFVKVTGGAAASIDTARIEMQRQACAVGADAVYIAVPTYPMCTLNTFQPVNMDGVLLKRSAAVPPVATGDVPPSMSH